MAKNWNNMEEILFEIFWNEKPPRRSLLFIPHFYSQCSHQFEVPFGLFSMHIYIYMNINIFSYTHGHIHRCAHTHVHIYTHVYTHIHTCTCTHTHMYLCVLFCILYIYKISFGKVIQKQHANLRPSGSSPFLGAHSQWAEVSSLHCSFTLLPLIVWDMPEICVV